MKTTPLHILAVLASLISPALAGPLREAKIHQIVNDVKIVEPRTGARPATLQDTIKDDIGVTTGPQSRAELLFQDNTLTRLGAETFFSFEPGTRNVNLERGSMLLQVPKNRGGAHIRAASVSASITGTTITVEHLPGKRVKITVLEGSLDVNVTKRPADRVTLRAGKTVTISPNTKTLPQPTEANLRNVVRTSPLVTPALFNAKSESHAAALPSMGLIEKEIARQEGAPTAGDTASAVAPAAATEPAAPKINAANASGDKTKKNVAVASSSELATLLATAAPDASGKVKFSAGTDLDGIDPAAKAKSGGKKTSATSGTASMQLAATSARRDVIKANDRSGNMSGGKTSTTTSLVAVNSTTGSSGGGASGSGGGTTTTTSTTTSLLGSSSAPTGGSSLPTSGGTTSGRGSSYLSAFIAAVTSAINTAMANGGTTTGGSSGSGSGGGGKSGSSKKNKKS